MRFVTKNLNFHRVSFHCQNIFRREARNCFTQLNVIITSCIVDKAPSIMEEFLKVLTKFNVNSQIILLSIDFFAIKYLVFNWTNFQQNKRG